MSMPTFPSEDPFTRSSALLVELSVLRQFYDVAMELGAALKHAYTADALMNTHSDRTVSVEASVAMSSPNASRMVRELRGWYEDAKDYEIRTVPGTVPIVDLHERLAHLRKGYSLVTYFTDLVRMDSRRFPQPFLRKLELAVLAMQSIER